MELVRQAVEKLEVPYNEAVVTATVTIGVSSFQTSRPVSPPQLFARADSAMYQGKRAGKNCVRAFERETS
jgi:diguanylate cyclase (GGDEF)-like protein